MQRETLPGRSCPARHRRTTAAPRCRARTVVAARRCRPSRAPARAPTRRPRPSRTTHGRPCEHIPRRAAQRLRAAPRRPWARIQYSCGSLSCSLPLRRFAGASWLSRAHHSACSACRAGLRPCRPNHGRRRRRRWAAHARARRQVCSTESLRAWSSRDRSLQSVSPLRPAAAAGRGALAAAGFAAGFLSCAALDTRLDAAPALGVPPAYEPCTFGWSRLAAVDAAGFAPATLPGASFDAPA